MDDTDLFYQVVFSAMAYVTFGRYFRTMDEGVAYLKEDAKKREIGVYPPMGRLETRSFDPSHVNMIVAKQYHQDTTTHRKIRVHILAIPEEAPRYH